MNRTIVLALAIALSPSLAEARPVQCRSQVIVRSASVSPRFVVTDIAVPIGVPVAVYSSYWYSTGGLVQPAGYAVQQAHPQLQQAQTAQQNNVQAESVPPPLPQRPAEPMLSPPVRLLSATCVKCHGGAKPKAGLSLEHLDELTDEQRLKAVRMVLTERMPKGGPRLTAVEAGLILDALTQPAAVSADQPGDVSPGAPPQPQE